MTTQATMLMLYYVLLLLVCTQPLVFSQSLKIQCPKGWIEIYGLCYQFVPEITLPWDQSSALCQRYGGWLVRPAGIIMTEKVVSLVSKLDTNITSIWTGYNRKGLSSDKDIDGVWSDGSPTNVDVGVWGDEEPKIQTGACASIRNKNGNWLWYMEKCESLNSIVCEVSPCPVGTFHCDSGLCLSNSLLCNGENNCGDFSDERNCSSEPVIRFPQNPLEHYANEQTCHWFIEGAIGRRIHIKVIELDTEPGIDFLEVWVGGKTLSTSVLLEKFSGTHEQLLAKATLLYSYNNLAILRFVSDKTISRSGFTIQWSSDFTCDLLKIPDSIFDDASNFPELSFASTEEDCYSSCLSDVSCSAMTYENKTNRCYKMTQMSSLTTTSISLGSLTYVKTCPGLSGKQILPNVPVQESILYATRRIQQLMSPLYPLYYPSEYTYIWTIYAPGQNLITLEIIFLKVANKDYLHIYDGSSLESDIIVSLSSKIPYKTPIISTGNSLLVYFHSKSVDRAQGFLLSYKAGCFYETTSRHGEIYSPGFNLNNPSYPNVMNCTWIIHSDQKRPLHMVFTNFSLESGKDYLQVYRDSDETPVNSGLGFTGDSLPPSLVSLEGRLKLVMKSGAIGSGQGFKAFYETGCSPLNQTSLIVNPPMPAFPGMSFNISCQNNFIFDRPYKGTTFILIACELTGNWDKTVPTCTNPLCNVFPTIPNGNIIKIEELIGGSLIRYKCNTGYKSINDDSTSICISTGQWLPSPICVSISQCHPQRAPLSGQMEVIFGNGTEHRSIIHFSCLSGYELVGAAFISCINESWSSDTPTCLKIKCGLPYISNATLTSPSPSVAYGDLINVTCYPGFNLTGSGSFHCGTTSALPSCDNIDECSTGQSRCNQMCVDEIGSYKCLCSAGYLLSADNHTCEDVDECSHNNGDCEQLCTNTISSYICSCPNSNASLFQYDGQSGVFIPKSETGLQPWNIYYLNHSCIGVGEIFCPKLLSFINNGHALSYKSRYTVGDTLIYLCNVGFTLIGSPRLTCMSTGQWDSTPPTCTVSKCIPPATSSSTVSPSNAIGYLEYFTATCNVQGLGVVEMKSRCVFDVEAQVYQADVSSLQCPPALTCGIPKQITGTEPYRYTSISYGSSFILTCRSYYDLEGKSSIGKDSLILCMANGQWDFGDLRCTGPTCTDPGSKPGVTQIATSYEENSLVYFHCEKSGFELTDKWPLLCEWNNLLNVLQWNSSTPDCVDVESPKILNCPTQEIIIDRLSSPNLPEPIAVDNVQVTSFTTTPAHFYMSHVISVNKTVQYKATDTAGNQAICEIHFIIRDDTPPTLECIPSFTYTLTNNTDVKTFDFNQFVTYQHDDSGTVYITYHPQNLVVDKYSDGKIYSVKISATDPSGNSYSCLVQIRVQAPACVGWSLVVPNGRSTCTEVDRGVNCTITCQSGYVFYENPQLTSVNMSCSTSEDWSRNKPMCVAQRDSIYLQYFQYKYTFGSEPNSVCSIKYKLQLESSLSQLMLNLNELCNTNVPVTMVNVSLLGVSLVNTKVFASFSVETQSLVDHDSIPTMLQCVELINLAFTQVTVSPVLRFYLNGSCPGSGTAEYITTLQSGYKCNKNEELINFSNKQTCVSCPPGLFNNDETKCAPCPPGSYLDSMEEICKACSPGSRWINTGATSEMDCYLTCPYGYVSTSGKAICQICPVNTFSYNLQTCSPCQPGQFTSAKGQGSVNNCKDACLPGYFSKDGLEPCRPCPKGFYQSSSQAIMCTECPSNYITSSTASTSATDCIDGISDLCSNSVCLNGGLCQVAGQNFYCICKDGYSGRNCEFLLSPCLSQPCYNQGNCLPTGISTYTCDCSYPHISGTHCEVNNNDICSNNPCGNFGACQTQTNNFTCICPSFSSYTNGNSGYCNQLRNPCEDTPCQNGAICEVYGNIRRFCKCLPGYTGNSCEIDIDSCQLAPCKNNATCIDRKANQFVCVCLEGYGGDLCEIPVNKCSTLSCPPFASCVDNYITKNIFCICEEGFTKDAFGDCILSDVCDPNPCENGGTCYKDGNTYQCSCISGYEGVNCQHNINDCEPNPCLNGGVCSDLNPPSTDPRFSCLCPEETFGSTCVDSVDLCQDDLNPCNKQNSTCIDLFQDYYCSCDSGFHGKNCSESSNMLCKSFPCLHGGTCLELDGTVSCQCAEGYSGKDCNIFVDHCLSFPCLNNATCLNYDQGYICFCQHGYSGITCEENHDLCEVSNPCQEMGNICYSQVDCHIKDLSCSQQFCLNGGTCVENSTELLCYCSAGLHCESNIDDCFNDPCPLNSECIDGVNSYTCHCIDRRFGISCKIVSIDFDIILLAKTGYQLTDYQLLIQPINSMALTVSTWVRYTKKQIGSIIFSLYELSYKSNFNSTRAILVLQSNQVMFGNNTNSIVNFTASVTDGLWHHIVLTWNLAVGNLLLYVDGRPVVDLTNATLYPTLLSNIWLILGGEYEFETESVNHSIGMVGRLSRIFITNKTIIQSEINLLVSNMSYSPEGWIASFTILMASGTTTPVDFNSELSSGICTMSSSCTSLNNILPSVKFLNCPSEQVIISNRVAYPIWDLPKEPNNTAVVSSLLTGQTKMGWGTYSVTYASFDSIGNADVCTVKIFNRRSQCFEAKPNEGQIHICNHQNSSLRCSVQCSKAGYGIALETSKYYTCGLYGMYDASEQVLPFYFPSCSLCTNTLKDYAVRLNYSFTKQAICGSQTQLDLESLLTAAIHNSLSNLQNIWPELCSMYCLTLPIRTTCLNDYEVSVHWILSALGEFLDKFDHSETKSVKDLLMIAVVDDGHFTYDTIATPDVQSLVINVHETCPVGKIFLHHCCFDCPEGFYYNAVKKECTACDIGFYLNASGTIGADLCEPCPLGQTTFRKGATSSLQCFTICERGTYYNLSTNQCSDCAVGFYSETEGMFYCDACDFTQTTTTPKSISSFNCSVDPKVTLPPTTSSIDATNLPSVGAVTSLSDESTVKNLLITLIVILIVIAIVLLIYFCCLRQYCTCFYNTVTPEGPTQWKHVNKFGETKIKFVKASMRDLHAQNDQKVLVTKNRIQSPVAKVKLQIPAFNQNSIKNSAPEKNDVQILYDNYDKEQPVNENSEQEEEVSEV